MSAFALYSEKAFAPRKEVPGSGIWRFLSKREKISSACADLGIEVSVSGSTSDPSYAELKLYSEYGSKADRSSEGSDEDPTSSTSTSSRLWQADMIKTTIRCGMNREQNRKFSSKA